MDKFVLSVMVQNHAGVLSRVSGLFSRRGYNIDSLTVCETDDPGISRMTIVVKGDEYILDQIQKQLSKYFMCDYDEAGSIGKRYRREDEIGTPFCITVDDDTLNNGTVTIRDRDTMKQDVVKLEDVKDYILNKCEY